MTEDEDFEILRAVAWTLHAEHPEERPDDHVQKDEHPRIVRRAWSQCESGFSRPTRGTGEAD